MKVKTVIQGDKRYHIISGGLIECSGTVDCNHCTLERNSVIEEWIKKHNSICIICDEKPPCYICLKSNCKDWWKDKAFNEEMGTHSGCRKSLMRTYCNDFTCKYGFLGWWEDGWEKAFEERSKAIDEELLSNLRKKKEKDNGSPKQPVRKAAERKPQ
jgi:hypothetical protein